MKKMITTAVFATAPWWAHTLVGTIVTLVTGIVF